MKIRHTTKALLPVLLLVMFASCKKDAPSIFDMFKVKLTFNQGQPYAVDENGDIEITSKDEVIIDYTIESPDEDMYVICLYKNGGNAPVQKIPITDDGKRRVYSGTFKFKASDLGAGQTTYRIWPLDKIGVYMGDGYKKVTINVLSDLKYYSNIKVFMPDTTGKVDPCYLSLGDAGPDLYSYTTGAANSAKIDFGFYSKVVQVNPTTTRLDHYMYSLTASPLPFTPYDISSWAKRGTLFSAPVTSNATAATWKTRFNTGAKIEAEAKAVNINLTSSPVIAANNFVFFKTPEGKYGVMFIQSLSQDYLLRRYIWLSYKMPDY
jgi:hypothetical protein